jgi:hypothetical protein
MSGLDAPRPGPINPGGIPSTSVRRIIVAKTSSASYVRAAVANLGASFPDAELYVWSEERESEEFYTHPVVTGVILYLNIPAVPAMVRRLRALNADLVAIQVTRETTYDKLKLLAFVLFPGQGIILDAWGRIARQGTWSQRLILTSRDVVSGWQVVQSIWSIPWRLVTLVREIVTIGLFPFLLLRLMVGAARAELSRRAYLRRAQANNGG